MVFFVFPTPGFVNCGSGRDASYRRQSEGIFARTHAVQVAYGVLYQGSGEVSLPLSAPFSAASVSPKPPARASLGIG